MAFDSRLLSGIQVLVAAVEAGSFVRAATALGITQSGVSRAIARLERRVGVRLFDRTARAIALTDEGRSFYQRMKPLLEGVEDAATEAAGSAAAVRGRLRVNVDPFFARLILAPRIGKFLTAYPELSVEIVGRDRLGDLVSDGFDAAVRFGEPEPSALVARRLLETRVLTCAAPSYLAKHGRRRIRASSGRGATNASFTWTPSLVGRFPGSSTVAGRNSGSQFPAVWRSTMSAPCSAPASRVTEWPNSWRSESMIFFAGARSSSCSRIGPASGFRFTCSTSRDMCRRRRCAHSWIS
jgi:DNA-binding transcriptional LysR family regulator